MIARSILLCAMAAATNAYAAADNVSVRYLDPIDKTHAQYLTQIQQSGVNDTLVDLAESIMPFSKPLVRPRKAPCSDAIFLLRGSVKLL